MKLSGALRGRVLGQLQGRSLVSSDFIWRFDPSDPVVVEIEVRGHSHLRFVIRTSGAGDEQRWETLESPGPLFRGAETNRFQTIEDAIGYIGDWLGRVEEYRGVLSGAEDSSANAQGQG